MRIVIDTDVLLDVALNRSPHVFASSAVMTALQQGRHDGLVAWHTISNLSYMLSVSAGRERALEFIRDLSRIVDVAPADSDTLDIALSLRMRDFEDAMQVASALSAAAEVIVTRNVRDFRNAPIRAVSPADLPV